MRVTNRYAAFAVHLGISFVMFLVLAAIIKFLWYPGVLFETEGGWDGIKLIAGVDLVIGPTLTLMVYNIAKKELKRDLAIIGLLQAACIVGGMGTVAYSRPIAVIYAAGTFFVATQQRFDNHDIDTSQVELLQQRKPVWIAVDVPTQQQQRLEFLQKWGIKGGFDLAVPFFRSYEKSLGMLANEGRSTAEIEKAGFTIPSEMKSGDSIRIYTLQTRYGNYKVACNIDSGELVALIRKTNQ
jgi:hypothetical protein